MVFASLLFATGVLGQGYPAQLPFLSPVFGSHMVLQRDRPNTFWGWTAPGAPVTLTVAGRHTSSHADSNGKWVVRFSPPPTGGPYAIDVDGPSHARLDDVLVGDVWICSGQSNMEMGIGLVNNAKAEIADANHPGIRLYIVQHSTSLTPVPTPVGAWEVCSPGTVGSGGWAGFSAAGYFFGRELNERLKIPIGLVETNWGGTIAEAWTSKRGLVPLGDFDRALSDIDSQVKPGSLNTAQKMEAWYRQGDPGSASADWQKADFDDSSWKAADPSPRLEDVGLSNFDGVVWFRKEVDLPDPLPAGESILQLGTVDDMDTTWVNGQKVGESYSYGDWRRYRVPASVLKPGRNVIAVRVLDTGGPGGLVSLDSLALLIGGKSISLRNGWRFSAGGEFHKMGPMPRVYSGDPNYPTVLYNGMIAPLLPLSIKGAIWYQGESNADRAKQYQRLLPALIGDWRKSFGQGDFPFLVVQLANFSKRHPEPVDDAWADLREAQTLTVQRVPNTGLACAIDIGDGGDIHPKNKQEVGRRLALAALHVAYRRPGAFCGPQVYSVTRAGSTLRVTFAQSELDKGLEFRGPHIVGFQIAGADHKFYWADAQISGSSVLLSSPSVPEPVSVRYAWDTNPDVNLYSGAGLPALPFRSDVP